MILRCAPALVAAFQVLLPENDPTCGVNAYSGDDYAWRGQVIFHVGEQPVSDYEPSGEDFFRHEYGVGLDFSDPNVLDKTEAHVSGACSVERGALALRPNAQAGTPFRLTFGKDEAHRSAPGIRFAKGLTNATTQRVYLELDVEQAGPTSSWRFVTFSRDGSPVRRKGDGVPFSAVGTARQRLRIPVCMGQGNMSDDEKGVGLVCLTPEALPRIYSVRILPLSGHVYYRKSFRLDFRPVEAKLSFLIGCLDDYDFFVNGVNLARPTKHLFSVAPVNLEISRHLHPGENVIAVRYRHSICGRYLCGSEPPTRLLLDLFAYDREGRSAFVGSGTDWRTTYVAPDAAWTRAGYDDSGWKRPGVGSIKTVLANGTPTTTGLDPQHMGFLSAKPVDAPYPVFPAEPRKPRLFRARYPAGLTNAALAVSFRRVASGERLSPRAVGGREEGGLRVTDYELPGTRPGPYRLEWTLTADGVSEKRSDEVVLVGRIDQPAFGPAEFEEKFRERLELAQTIDPVREHAIGPRFISSEGRANRFAETCVRRTGDLAYLSLTNSGFASWMGWRLDTPDLGGAYHLEVDVPDDAERTVIAAVAHSTAAALDNCPPPYGSAAQFDATAAITTGAGQRPSGGKKTLTLVFYAANRISTVVVAHAYSYRHPRLCAEPVVPAAVCAIRLYRVRGGLPALRLPPTNRRLFEHHERFTTWQTLAATQNIVEQGCFHPLLYHRNAWTHWYGAIDRKIRLLRFQGQNASVEGLLMYQSLWCPSESFRNGANDGREFDVPYLLSWMYDANGIECYFGWEYNRSDSLLLRGVEKGVSDRRIRRGEARGIYMVDAKGEQRKYYADSGVNFLAPGVKEDFFDSLREVYGRYAREGHVKGLFLAHGFYWVPGFLSTCFDNSMDVGFDDDSMDVFVRDTGIRLDVSPKDPDRFARRAALLNGVHRDRYLAWRRAKLTEWYDGLRDLLRSGAHPWKLMLSPNFSHGAVERDCPFQRTGASASERDGHLARRMAEEGWNVEVARRPGMQYFLPVGINPAYKWGACEQHRVWTEFNLNRGTQDLIGKAGSVYAAYMLSEMPLYVKAPDAKWYWRGHSALCSYQRPAGEAAYMHELEMCREHVPEAMVIAGIDCNPYTGQAEECRRFAAGFYAVPSRAFAATSAVTGVDARTAGAYLRLYNASSDVLVGRVRAKAAFACEALGLSGKDVAVTLRPYSMAVFRATDERPDYRGAFERSCNRK